MKFTAIKMHVIGIGSADGDAPLKNWIFFEVTIDEGFDGVGEVATEYREYDLTSFLGLENSDSKLCDFGLRSQVTLNGVQFIRLQPSQQLIAGC